MTNHINYFCTITTNSYLLKALALYESMCIHTDNNFHIWICTIDELAYDLLIKLNLHHASIIEVGALESESLLEAKNNRYVNEYCWTIKASLVKLILKQHNYIDSILYLDSDTFMYSNPDSFFDSLKKNDVLLTSHNFTSVVDYSTRQKGLYNAGIVGFKNSRNALRILNWWENRCIEWCYNEIQPNRFGDQKYLETIKNKHSKTAVIESVGGNAAMWNIEYCDIKKLDNKVYINNDILIFFHFCIFFIINENEFELWECICPKLENSAMQLIFIPYVQAIKNAINQVKKYETDISLFLSGKNNSGTFYNYLKL
ncbi:MAG TPA: putative nucleotide-diphospho-sugar transferase [Clostridia bacterium]|nr:putative nucleotide-diphospho-sugar transferase [Clostridia bacterium]